MRLCISLSTTKPAAITEKPFKDFLMSIGLTPEIAAKLGAEGISFRKGAYEKRIALRSNAVKLAKMLEATLGEPEVEDNGKDGSSRVWTIAGKGFITIDINYKKQCTFNVVLSNQPKKRVPK